MREHGTAAMPTFDTTPCLDDLDITDGTVEVVASKLSGSASALGWVYPLHGPHGRVHSVPPGYTSGYIIILALLVVYIQV